MTIYFDMDGTIADLYGVSGWLDMLRAEDEKPYEIAKPLVNMARLAKALNKAKCNGAEIGVISWTSKGGTNAYNAKVANAKREWLAKHLPSVEWDDIKVVDYGTPKFTLAEIGDILFDDEKPNRTAWGVNAYEPTEIFKVLAMV